MTKEILYKKLDEIKSKADAIKRKVEKQIKDLDYTLNSEGAFLSLRDAEIQLDKAYLNLQQHISLEHQNKEIEKNILVVAKEEQ